MEGFEWGQRSLGGNTPEELQRRGLNIYFAPNVPTNTKVVNLASGQIDSFREAQHRPKTGYYADFDSLVRYCERNGAPLKETDGLAILQSAIRPAPVAVVVEDVPNTGSPDGGRLRDLRGFATAFDAREHLPELAAWMTDDQLRQVRIWRGARFERGRTYFDLDHPERGVFVATGDEGPIADHTYVCRDEVMEDVWAQLITWHYPVGADQAESIRAAAEQFSPARTALTGSVDSPPLPGGVDERGGPSMRGIVADVVIDRGFGFIDGDDGRRYFFHVGGLSGADFADLAPGVAVRFLVVEHAEGDEAGEHPRAVNVRLAEDAVPAAEHESLARAKSAP